MAKFHRVMMPERHRRENQEVLAARARAAITWPHDNRIVNRLERAPFASRPTNETERPARIAQGDRAAGNDFFCGRNAGGGIISIGASGGGSSGGAKKSGRTGSAIW